MATAEEDRLSVESAHVVWQSAIVEVAADHGEAAAAPDHAAKVIFTHSRRGSIAARGKCPITRFLRRYL